MGQDGVFQKILTSPISLMNIFLGHPVEWKDIHIHITQNQNTIFWKNNSKNSTIHAILQTDKI